MIAILSNYKNSGKQDGKNTTRQLSGRDPKLAIEFGDSLKLLSMQDIILLLQICKNQNIKLLDIDTAIEWSKAVGMSRKLGIDITSTSHARDATGSPYLSKAVKLGTYLSNISKFEVMKKLFKEDFDVNLHDLTTGETLIYDLLRNFDKQSIEYLFDTIKFEKKLRIYLNYYNKNGLSPLGVALNLYKKEKERQERPKTQRRKSALIKDKSIADSQKALNIAQRNAAKQNIDTFSFFSHWFSNLAVFFLSKMEAFLFLFCAEFLCVVSSFVYYLVIAVIICINYWCKTVRH